MRLMQKAQLILASASPRREELLSLAGITFQVIPSEVSEEMVGSESPEEHVCASPKRRPLPLPCSTLMPGSWGPTPL